MTMTKEEYKKGVRDTLNGLQLIIEKLSNAVEFETAVKSFVDVTENQTLLADEAPTETSEMSEMRNNVDDFLKTQWKKQYNETDALRAEYEAVCNRYLRHFCENYGFACEPSINDAWIGEKHGDCAMVDDLRFDFSTIKYAVEMHLTDVDELLEWHDYCADSFLYGYESPTFKAWHSGCPRLSEKQIAELRKMREGIHEHNGMSYD